MQQNPNSLAKIRANLMRNKKKANLKSTLMKIKITWMMMTMCAEETNASVLFQLILEFTLLERSYCYRSSLVGFFGDTFLD